jgi:outer membrane protein insertion porin family
MLVALALAAGPARAQGGQEKVKVLVLPFQVNAPGDKESLRKNVSQLLVERLRQQGVTVLDAAQGASVMAAKKIKEVDTVQTARELARAAGAGFAVYGSLNQVGDALSLDVKTTPANGSGEPQPVYSTAPDLKSLPQAATEVAQKIKGDFVPSEGKVAEVDVEGNAALEKDVILLKVKTQPGEPFDPKTVNDDLKRLYDLGYFDDVQIRTEDVHGGKRVVFVVKEKPRIQAIGVVGNSDIKKDDILEAMSTKAGNVLNPQVLADDLEKVRELYRKKGYYQTEVSYSLEQTDPRMARLNINVKESKKLYIKEIKIDGAKQVSPSDLKEEMGLKERNWLSWIMQTGVLKEELLERDSAAIENYYTNRGFIDAKVGQPTVDIRDDGIHITFTVDEGARYKVGNVNFKGDLLLDESKLRELSKLNELSKKKDFFDRSVVREDVTKLTDAYSDLGYAFAEVDPDVQKRGDEKIVDVTYAVSKGQKVYVRRVIIEGNDRTRENVIRRELKLSDGDLFSGSKLKRSNERLNKLDYFDKVDIETVPTEDPSEVDLRVKVKDKNTGKLELGIGYSTSDSVFFGGSVGERNLFGKGYELQFQGMFSGRTNRFMLSFTNPAVYDSQLAAGMDIYSTFHAYDDFWKETQGARLRFSYPLGEYTSVNWEYHMDRDRVFRTNPLASSIIFSSRGVHWTSAVGGDVTRDTTDSKTKPTKGTINTLGTELAGPGGDVGYVKGYYNFHFFQPLIWETVFHTRLAAGAITPDGYGNVPVFERFYLGGINNVRGYAQDELSPRDHRTFERIGGDTMYFGNLEYIVPVSKSYGVYSVGFFDFGDSMYRERDGLSFNPYKAIGAGLRWYSPLGLIRVEYGYGLDASRQHQNPSQIGFTMGQTF